MSVNGADEPRANEAELGSPRRDDTLSKDPHPRGMRPRIAEMISGSGKRLGLTGCTLIIVGVAGTLFSSWIPYLNSIAEPHKGPATVMTNGFAAVVELLLHSATGVGEALVIAWFLTVTAEGRLRQVFVDHLQAAAGSIQRSFADDSYWELKFPNAPAPYRAALKALSEYHVFSDYSRFEITFEPAEDHMNLDIRWISRISNHGSRPERLRATGWIVGSRGKEASRWLQAVYECEDQRFFCDYIKEHDTRWGKDEIGNEYFVGGPGRQLTLAPRQGARTELHGTTQLELAAHLPLFNHRPVLAAHVVIRGERLERFRFRVRSRGGVEVGLMGADDSRTIQLDGARLPPEGTPLDEVFLVGQHLEIAWWRKEQDGIRDTEILEERCDPDHKVHA